jgi:hypothetical protein
MKNAVGRNGRIGVTLLGEIDRYLRVTGMPATKFGRLAVGDPRLVGDLRRGRMPRDKLVARVEAFMAARGLRGWGA